MKDNHISNPKIRTRILSKFKELTGIDMNTHPLTDETKREEAITRLLELVQYHIDRGMTPEGATITTVDELATEQEEIRTIGPEAYNQKYHITEKRT